MKRVSEERLPHSPKKLKSGRSGPGYSSKAVLWLVQNYERYEGGETTARDLLCKYASEKEHLGFYLDSAVLGRIMSDVFGDEVRSVKKQIDRVRGRVYVHLRKRQFENNPVTDSNEQLQGLCFQDGERIEGWSFLEHESVNGEQLQFLKSTRKEILETGKVVTIAVLNLKEGNVLVKCMGIKTSGEELGILTRPVLRTRDDVSIILRFLNTFETCTGFASGSLNGGSCNVNVDNGRILTVIDGEQAQQECVQSTKCKVLFHSSANTYHCSACSLLRRKISRRKMIKQSQNSNKIDQMTRKQLEETMKKQRSIIQAARKKERYWKNKFKQVTEETVE